MLPISGYSRLSFNSHREYRNFAESNATLLAQVWLWHETLGNRKARIEFPGICDLCECATDFSATPQRRPPPRVAGFEFGVTWWADAYCKCGRNNMERAALRVFLEHHIPDDRVYHVGHFSGFRTWLTERVPNVVSSQYDPGHRSGEVAEGIRYEDLTCLSFRDGEFTSIICMEILEHIPDYRAALRQMARVLEPGGRAYLTFPWLGGDTYEHLIRAELLPDGTVQHHLPPEYHGDTVSSEGILSFRGFGWKILDELREDGFSQASAEFVFSPLNGYMLLLCPVIVATR
jgi:SAM-dependent methyltransferase